MISSYNIPNYSLVSFSLNVLILSWFVSSIPSVICLFWLFLISMTHFSLTNSISISWLYILTSCSLMSSMYIKWLIFSRDLWSFYPAMHFLSILLSGIMAITNSNGDSVSLWKIHHWIFTSAKLFPPTVSSTLQFYMVFSINFMTSPDICYILQFLCSTISYAFLSSIHAISRFFRLVLMS